MNKKEEEKNQPIENVEKSIERKHVVQSNE
jgi:hypothetical protein